jgi:hypothetical protein
MIAGATQKELARQVRYLKVENEILRSKFPARVTVSTIEFPQIQPTAPRRTLKQNR